MFFKKKNERWEVTHSGYCPQYVVIHVIHIHIGYNQNKHYTLYNGDLHVSYICSC